MSHPPTVVLLHSSASSSRQWQRLQQSLQARFRVLTVDFHGHGATPPWRSRAVMTLADEAALVEPLLAQTGGAHLIAHSYGAAVALKLASLRPQWVRSVVAYEPVLFRWLLDDSASLPALQEVLATADFVSECVARGDTQAAAVRFVDLWSGDGAWASMAPGAQQAVASRMPSVAQHFVALLHEPLLQRARLAALRMPMLLLTGAQTVAALRRIAALLQAALPRAQHETLPRMGHMGPLTHAGEVNRRIEAFLRNQTDGDSHDEKRSFMAARARAAHSDPRGLVLRAAALGIEPGRGGVDRRRSPLGTGVESAPA